MIACFLIRSFPVFLIYLFYTSISKSISAAAVLRQRLLNITLKNPSRSGSASYGNRPRFNIFHQSVLLQNRVKKDWRGYALPGGHVEPGESFVDAVIREMKEETGLTILNPRLVGVKQFPLENGRYVVLLFKATQWSGDLISSEEGQMEWIKYSDLSVVKTVDDFDDLLKVMNTPELTEFQYLVSGDEWTVSIR